MYSALGAAFISLAIISSGFSKILNNLDEKHWLRSIYFLEWLYDVKPLMEKQTEEQQSRQYLSKMISVIKIFASYGLAFRKEVL